MEYFMIEIFACQSNIDVISMDLTGMSAIVRIAWVTLRSNVRSFSNKSSKNFEEIRSL